MSYSAQLANYGVLTIVMGAFVKKALQVVFIYNEQAAHNDVMLPTHAACTYSVYSRCVSKLNIEIETLPSQSALMCTYTTRNK